MLEPTVIDGVMVTAVTGLVPPDPASSHNLLPGRELGLPLGEGQGLQLQVGDGLGGVQGGAQQLLDLSREQPGPGVCGEVEVEVDILQESVRTAAIYGYNFVILETPHDPRPV